MPIRMPSSPPKVIEVQAATAATSTEDNPVNRNDGVGSGPGPTRHRQPLTAASLHLEVEQEQEAVVNRLTRELLALQQQTALLAASMGASDIGQHLSQASLQSIQGPMHFTSARHRRSSSSLSGHSGRSGSILGSGPLVTDSVGTGITPARDQTAATVQHPARGTMSRQHSFASRRSTASSPINANSPSTERFPMHPPSHGTSATGPQPPSAPHARQSNPPPAPPPPPSSTSPSASLHAIPITGSRYEEVARRRSELDVVKLENQQLRARVQELERSTRRHGGDPPARSK